MAQAQPLWAREHMVQAQLQWVQTHMEERRALTIRGSITSASMMKIRSTAIMTGRQG
jgi:hypothetical protein